MEYGIPLEGPAGEYTEQRFVTAQVVYARCLFKLKCQPSSGPTWYIDDPVLVDGRMVIRSGASGQPSWRGCSRGDEVAPRL